MEYKKSPCHEDGEEAAACILMGWGFRKTVAQVLVYLISHQESAMRDIERGANLRQPEVSLATADLSKSGWISCRSARGPGKGRPVKIFRIAKPFEEILLDIEEKKRKEALILMQNLERLQVSARECGTGARSRDDPAFRQEERI